MITIIIEETFYHCSEFCLKQACRFFVGRMHFLNYSLPFEIDITINTQEIYLQQNKIKQIGCLMYSETET